ncbi:MAG: 1-acyl-sn-glycerol-3-phosphate acyltransferase [Planctomycetes bacterium]|nr:1-acyl-sn-glycerol-3-phosphate acyltransferase [Planctomycetota bacterium]
MSREQHVLVDQTRPTGWRGWIYRTAVNLAAAMGRVLFLWNVEGTDNIPREGGTLIVANHPSFLEPPSLVCIMIYFADRDISIMAWHKLFRIPVVRFFTKVYKAYPVNRENPGRGPYQTLVHILKNGGAAGVFPEGSRSEGRLMGPWKPGALRAAFTAKATILPITFVTAGEFWPRSSWRPRFFRKHHIKVHEALTHEQYMAQKPADVRDKDYQEQLAEHIRTIVNQPILDRLGEGEARMLAAEAAGDGVTRAEQAPEHTREARYAAAQTRLSA